MTDHEKQTIKNLLRDDGGSGLIVDVLKARRATRHMSIARLSRLGSVPIKAIEQLEVHDFDAARVKDLLLVAKVLGYHALVALVPRIPAVWVFFGSRISTAAQFV